MIDKYILFYCFHVDVCLAFGIHFVLLVIMIVWSPEPNKFYGAALLATCWGIGDGILGTLTISTYFVH